MIEEARRRGLNEGHVKDINGIEFNMNAGCFVYDEDSNVLYYNGATIFKGGKWATIIEEDKFAELKEAHKNGAVIEVEYRKPYSENVTWNESNEDVLWNPALNHRIKPEDKPKAGDVVGVWNNNSLAKHIIGTLEDIHLSKHYGVGGHWYDNAQKLTKQEVIDLLFFKD